MNQKYLDILNKMEAKRSQPQTERVLIIDSLNTYLRIWSSVPFMAENGEHAGGIVGFLRSIGSNIRDYNPTKVILVFDGKGGSQRRKKEYKEYKEQRSGKYNIRRQEYKSVDDEQASMRKQMARLVEYLDVLPVTVICLDNVEADDVIAYMVSDYFAPRALSEGLTDLETHVRIVSTDRDFLQLVSDNVEVYSPVKKIVYTPDAIRSEFGFHPDNYLLYRVLTGDKSDNIDGVRGIGLKTLLKAFPDFSDRTYTVDEIVDCAASHGHSKAIYESISENRKLIERNHRLMQLGDVDISGAAKIKILEALKQPPKRSADALFKRMLLEDYIGSAFKYPDDWLRTTFGKLNRSI